MTVNGVGGTDGTDIDTEHTKLLIYELSLVLAIARRDAIGLLRERLAQVIDGSWPADQLSDFDVAGELPLTLANYAVALSTLSRPVPRSLRDFVGS